MSHSCRSKPVARQSVVRLLNFLPFIVPTLFVAALLAAIGTIVTIEPLGHDESELLHAAYLVAHGAVPWVDFFENHSPIYFWINAHLLAPDSILFAFYARLFHFTIYLLGACLFGIAGALWLDIERRLRWPFLLLSLTVYLPLSWTVQLGIVRPEGLSFAALFSAAIAAHYAALSGANRLWHLACGTLLALSALISMRTVPLCAIIGLLAILRAGGNCARVGVGALLAVGALPVIAWMAMTAPISGYYLWLIDFNGHYVPYAPRKLPTSAYFSIGVDLLAIAATTIAATLLWAQNRGAAIAERLIATAGRRSVIALLVAGGAIALCWIFVLADPVWGAQGFTGIVVASTFYICTLMWIAFRHYRDGGPEIFLLWLGLASMDWLSGIVRAMRSPGRPRPQGRHAVPFAIGVVVSVAAAMYILPHLPYPGPIGRLIILVQQRQSVRLDLATAIGWPGWILIPLGLGLLALTPLFSATASRQCRAYATALAIRIQFVLVAISATDLLAAILQDAAIWLHLRHGPSPDTANAVAAAVALGLQWPGTRPVGWGYVAVAVFAQFALALSSPSQAAAGALLGIVTVITIRNWCAARGFMFAVDRRGRVISRPGPSLRRIGMLFSRALGIARPPHTDATTPHDPSWRKLPRPPERSQICEDPRTPFIGVTAATLCFALICWGLTQTPNFTSLRYELSLQHPDYNFAYLHLALTEDPYQLHALEELIPLNERQNLGQWILWSHRYCQLLANETVEMRPTMHPVCVKDASFYWYGGQDILRMWDAHVPFTPQPPYNLANDIRKNKPAIMDVIFLQLNIPSRDLDPMLAREYVRLGDPNDKDSILVRKDWLRRQVQAARPARPPSETAAKPL